MSKTMKGFHAINKTFKISEFLKQKTNLSLESPIKNYNDSV